MIPLLNSEKNSIRGSQSERTLINKRGIMLSECRRKNMSKYNTERNKKARGIVKKI